MLLSFSLNVRSPSPSLPTGALDEYVALCDPRLALFTGEEAFVQECDERPQHKLTQFSIYDQHGHLCPFDSGLIERNVELLFSGSVMQWAH